MNAKDDDGSVSDFEKEKGRNYETNPGILYKSKLIMFLSGRAKNRKFGDMWAAELQYRLRRHDHKGGVGLAGR